MGRSLEQLKVAVIEDWPRCQRGNFWPELLAKIDMPINVSRFSVAEFVSAPEIFPRLRVDDCDVLIVNWDSINGDPDFGADIAQRWFAHRRRELWKWVAENSALLLIEGQATSHAPTQAAYDALLGEAEVRVSAPYDELDLSADQTRRMGKECRVTKRARNHGALKYLAQIRPSKAPTHAEMFRCAVLIKALEIEEWGYLYRGWFGWRFSRRTRLTWVPLLETDDGRWPRRPTMLGARIGANGVVIATTMLLASTGQSDLIKALLKAHKNGDLLPTPSRAAETLRRTVVQLVIPTVIPALLGGVVANRLLGGLLNVVAVVVVVAVLTAAFNHRKWLHRLAARVFGW